jgi:hypothetical protein
VQVGDFDADSIADLAVANRDSDTVSILLGNGVDGRGDGTFAPAVNIDVGPSPYKVVMADFDADGILDLATASYVALGDVSVLMGNGADGRGDGTFRRQDFAVLCGHSNALAVGDVDADGVLDLVTTCEGDGAGANLLKGNGDGTFQAAEDLGANGTGLFVVLADVNGDAILDALVAYFITGIFLCPGQGSDGVGDGTFGSCVPVAAVETWFFRVLDVNADGIQDIVATNFNEGAHVFLGGGTGGHADGTFTFLGNFPTEWMPDELVLADLNGDRIRDMVITLRYESTVDVFIGNGADGRGDGTFGPKHDIPLNSAMSVAAADFDSDGIVDLAVTQTDMSRVTILRGQGTCLAGP